jgi:hypothetical protein
MSTIIKDTYAGLVATCKASVDPAFTGFTIIDGPRVTTESDKARLFIGVDIDPSSGLAGEGVNNPSQIPGMVDEQSFYILCVSEMFSGDVTVIPTLRGQVLDVMEAVRTLCRTSSSGVVLGVPALASAYLGQWQLFQQQVSSGPYVGCMFRVECIAKASIT